MHANKAQSAIEFLSTYAWALLIIVVLLAVLFVLTSAPAGKQVLPSSCNIQPELPCQDSVLATLNSTSPIMYYITFTNDLGKPILIQSGSFNATTTGIGITGTQHSFGDCYPSFVLPGTQVICKAAISGNVAPPAGTKVNTLFSFSYRLCLSNIESQCTSQPSYQAAGNGLQDMGSSNAATFYAVTFQIDDNAGAQTVSNNGTIILNGQQYTSGQTALFTNGGNLPIIAVSPSQFAFAYWTATAPSTIIPSNIASSTLDLLSNTIVTAVSNQIVHAQKYFISITANPSSGGTVSPASGYYAKGTVLALSETNSSNYKFVSWTGTGSVSYTGTGTSNTITVNGPITEVASFSPISPPPSLIANVPDLFVAGGPEGVLEVYGINSSTNNVITQIRVPGNSGYVCDLGPCIAISADGKEAYVANNGAGGGLVTVNLTTYNTSNVVSLGVPGCVAILGVSPNDKTAAMLVDNTCYPFTSGEASNVVFVNLTTDTVSNTVPLNTSTCFNCSFGGIAIGNTTHGNEAYVSFSNTILVMNMKGQTVNVISGFGSPETIAFSPDGSKAYVADQGTGSIRVVDTSSNTIVANTPIANSGDFMPGIAVSPDGSRLYLVDDEGPSVNVIEATSPYAPIATIYPLPTPGGCCTNAYGATVSPDGSKVYEAGQGNGGMVYINATTYANTLLTSGIYWDPVMNPFGLTSGVAPLKVANITTATQYSLYGSPCAYSGNAITFSSLGAYGGTAPYAYQWYEQRGASPITAIPGATGLSYVFTPTSGQTGNWKFYLNATDANGAKPNYGAAVTPSVYVYNAPNTATIFNPSGIAIDPTTDYAYVAQGASCEQGYLTKVDLSTNSIVGSVQVSSNVPIALALAPSRNEAYLLNQSAGGAGLISVVDLSTFTQSGTISLQSTPPSSDYYSIAVTPDNSLAYVGDGNAISVISLGSLSVVNTIATSNEIYSIAPYTDSTKLYASGQNATLGKGGIYTINVASNTAAYTPLPFEPDNLAVSSDGNYIFATSAPGDFYNLSVSGFTINSNTLIESDFAESIALNPAGNLAYVQSYNTYVVNVVGSSVVANVPGIEGYIATGPAGYPYEYIAGVNTLDNYAPGLFIVDQATNTVVNTIT